MLSRVVSILTLVILLTSIAASVRARDLTVYCEYPPPSGVVKGSKGGLIYDQVWELMWRTRIPGPIKQVTWKRGYAELSTQKAVGLFPTTRTAEREELFHWVGPILQVEWVFYALADSGLKIKSLEDAKKVRAIGTYADDSKEAWLKARGFTNLVSVMDNVANLKKLYERRIDLMVGSPSVTDRWPAMYGYDPQQFVEAYSFNTVDLYLALSKDTPTDTVLALQAAFQDMLEDGSVRRYYDKWVPGLKPPAVP